MTKPDITELQAKELHDEVIRRVRAIDENALVKITIGRPDADAVGHFSDWHDKWKDKGGGWSDGFGKSPP